MKLHHAAALALVGWYLLIPPVIASSRVGHCLSFKPDTDQPLSAWTINRSYDSAKDCEKDRLDGRLAWESALAKAIAEIPPDRKCSEPRDAQDDKADNIRQPDAAWLFARCIATDDLRLKPN